MGNYVTTTMAMSHEHMSTFLGQTTPFMWGSNPPSPFKVLLVWTLKISFRRADE
jgi:hypothetical protein